MNLTGLKVYLVLEANYEGSYVHGVFTTKELAEVNVNLHKGSAAAYVVEVPLNKLADSIAGWH